MPGHAFLPPAGLSGAQSLLKGQQVTKDAKIRQICQMENAGALHPFHTPSQWLFLRLNRELLVISTVVSASPRDKAQEERPVPAFTYLRGVGVGDLSPYGSYKH